MSWPLHRSRKRAFLTDKLALTSQQKPEISINPSDVSRFALWCLLSTPPNFNLQLWLEEKFPGRNPNPAAHKVDDKDAASPTPPEEGSLNIPNTVIKFLLDQTIGAALNTIAFILFMEIFKGRSVEWAVRECMETFWPIMLAGYKFWPAVSIANFVLVPAHLRTTVGSVAGLLW